MSRELRKIDRDLTLLSGKSIDSLYRLFVALGVALDDLDDDGVFGDDLDALIENVVTLANDDIICDAYRLLELLKIKQ